MAESISFCYDSIRWLHAPDNSTSQDRNVHKIKKLGLQKVTVKCRSCEHVWLAMSSGPGCFIERAGGQYTFSCPECSVREHVALSIFE